MRVGVADVFAGKYDKSAGEEADERVFREMTPAGEQKRLLVAAAPTDTLRSIEESFEAAGVRIGPMTATSPSLRR